MALAGAAAFGIVPMQLGSLNFGGFTGMASASAAGQPVATPDPVFSGTLTSQQQTEMMAWGQAYWNKVEGVVGPGGTNAALGGFTFSTAAMNSPLFNPFYGPRQTLVNLGVIADSDCVKQLTNYQGTDAATNAKRQAVKDALVGLTLKTDLVAAPGGTTARVIKSLDASALEGVVAYTEGGKLVSEKLPLDIIVAAGADPQFVEAISIDTINAINAIVVSAPGYAAAATGGTEAQKLLTGGLGKLDSFELLIANVPRSLGVKGHTAQVLAVFSVYGALPLVHVQFVDATILVDAVNGNVAGPFANMSPLDARELVSSHPEAAGASGVAYLVGGGCPTTVAGWVPVPGMPATIPANWPRIPATPAFPIPGRSGGWTCWDQTPVGPCVCEQVEVFGPPALLPGLPGTIPPAIPAVTIRTRCSFPGGCFGPANVPPSITPPPSGPPFPPSGPSPLNTTGCTSELFKWW